MNKKTLPVIVLSLALCGLFFAPFVAQAANPIWEGRNPVECNQPNKDSCTLCDALKVAANVVDFLIKIALALGVLMIVYGAILMMISAGNQERYSTGKKAMTGAFIGVFIALTSWIIVNTVLHILAGEAAFPWSIIQCAA